MSNVWIMHDVRRSVDPTPSLPLSGRQKPEGGLRVQGHVSSRNGGSCKIIICVEDASVSKSQMSHTTTSNRMN